MKERGADQRRHEQSSFRVGEVAEDFDAVAADVAFVEDGGEKDAHVARVVSPTDQRREVRIVLAGLLRVRVLHRAAPDEGLEVQRLARPNIDGPTDAAFVQIRCRTLVDLDHSDELRRQQQIVEAAGCGELLEHEPVGDCDVVAIDRGVDEIR